MLLQKSIKLQQIVSLLVVLFLFLEVVASSSALAQKNEINWYSFEKALEQAKNNNKLVLVDVWAPWCGWCHKMKKESYPKLPYKMIDKFIFTRLNRDDHETNYHYQRQTLSAMRLAQELNAETVPTVVILSSKGEYIFHITGYLNAEKLNSLLQQMQEFTSRR